MKIFTGQDDVTILEEEWKKSLEKNPYITIKKIGQSYVSSGEHPFTLMSVWSDN